MISLDFSLCFLLFSILNTSGLFFFSISSSQSPSKWARAAWLDLHEPLLAASPQARGNNQLRMERMLSLAGALKPFQTYLPSTGTGLGKNQSTNLPSSSNSNKTTTIGNHHPHKSSIVVFCTGAKPSVFIPERPNRTVLHRCKTQCFHSRKTQPNCWSSWHSKSEHDISQNWLDIPKWSQLFLTPKTKSETIGCWSRKATPKKTYW